MTRICVVALLALSFPGLSQNIADTAFVAQAVKSGISIYTQAIKGQTSLYNGSTYKRPDYTGTEHPFFGEDDWVTGSVQYNTHWFHNVPLLYDLYTDNLVTENFYNAAEIQLIHQKVGGFIIGNHRFKRMEEKSLPKRGFYELLYDGPTQALAQHFKNRRERIVSTLEIEITFEPKKRFFILKNGNYFVVKGKGSLLKVLADKKPELKQFITQNRLRFGTNPENMLKMVCDHYDAINKSS